MAVVKNKKTVTGERVSGWVINFILAIVVVITLYPFWHVLCYSFSDSRAAMGGGLFLWPREFSLLSYKLLLQTKQIFVAFGNSIGRTIAGTCISLVISALTAYPLSRRDLKGRSFFQLMIFFTMLFTGGIIPTYILLRNLNMLDTFWVYIIPAAMSPYNMFIMRNFFQSIPDSLIESAQLDGANHFQILLRIVTPLSGPAFGTLAMFYGVTNWNSYMDGVLYVNSQRLQLLQVYLRQLISSAGAKAALSSLGDLSETASVTEESMKMTVIAVSVIPVLIAYMFLQRYFVKGATVGSVKG